MIINKLEGKWNEAVVAYFEMLLQYVNEETKSRKITAQPEYRHELQPGTS